MSEADMRHPCMCSKQDQKGAAVACSWSCSVALAPRRTLMCGACWNAAMPHLACTTAGRLENFFGAITTKSSTTGKRKEPESTGKGKGAAAAKKSKAAGVGKSKK